MKHDSNLVERYSATERAQHWIVAISFILAALGGLALFYPAFFWLSGIFGGGPGTRILHPFFGVVMAVVFALLAARLWNHNRVNATDRKWMKRLGDVIANRDDDLPEVGRYNAAQKYLFWVMVWSVALLLVSGIAMWRPWFADAFPIWLNRIAVVVHAVAAFVLIAGFIVHVYAAIWVRGTVRAMTRGTVTKAWARHHHPGWYRETTARK